MNITLPGAGAMGSALTFPLVEGGHTVQLYGTEYDSETMAALKNQQDHPKLNLPLPEAVRLFDPEELDASLEGADVVLLSVNTNGIAPIMDALLPQLSPTWTLLTIAKGFYLQKQTVYPIASGIEAYMRAEGISGRPATGCLAGPSIASELARRSPTAVELSTTDGSQRSKELAEAFSASNFAVRGHGDHIGLEICAAFKNVYSIALSWPQGIGEKDDKEADAPTNLQAILLLQTLHELEQIIEVAGGQKRTASGLAGLGDLVATSGKGRNGGFGRLLGSGQTADEAMETLRSRGVKTVEGLNATPLALRYVDGLDGLDRSSLPLLSAIGSVIEGTTTPQRFFEEMDLKRYVQAVDS